MANKKQTTFRCAHPRVESNIIRYTHSINGKDYERCKLCREKEAITRHEREVLRDAAALKAKMERERFAYPREHDPVTAIMRGWQARSELRA